VLKNVHSMLGFNVICCGCVLLRRVFPVETDVTDCVTMCTPLLICSVTESLLLTSHASFLNLVLVQTLQVDQANGARR